MSDVFFLTDWRFQMLGVSESAQDGLALYFDFSPPKKDSCQEATFVTQAMIDSAIGFQVDSAYIALRQDAADSASINTIITTTTITGKIAADLRTNPKNLSRSHTIDSNSNGLLVGPFNVDSGVTITVNGTLMVV